MQKDVVSVLTADLHFMHRPPLARMEEEDWYKVQGGYLDQVYKIANGCPIIVAGDIFHKWHSPVELVNFIIGKMKYPIYAIPGQHDLPNHQYSLIKKSAYWTLVEAGKVINLPPGEPLEVVSGNPIRLWGFPWGVPVKPCSAESSICLDIAVIHDYIWSKRENTYYGSDKSKLVASWLKKLGGYHIAMFGDNHIPFCLKSEGRGLVILNCGNLMRLTVAQNTYQPAVWLLLKDGSIKRHSLDVSGDKFMAGLVDDEVTIDLSGVEELLDQPSTLSESAIDFSSAVLGFLREQNIGGSVKQYILRALDQSRR